MDIAHPQSLELQDLTPDLEGQSPPTRKERLWHRDLLASVGFPSSEHSLRC